MPSRNSPLTAPFSSLIAARLREREELRKYPEEELCAIIREVGFSCDLCGRCCTRVFNGHVLLFDEDVDRIRETDPLSLEPVPLYDFCDQQGTFYAAGYTTRSQGDADGTCIFLEKGRCRIYSLRPAVCRVYPYMLHREPDEAGVTDWRQISGLDLHGEYHADISREESVLIARETMEFEDAALSREIEFLNYSGEYFQEHGLRHVRKMYGDGMRRARQGGEIAVMVYHRDHFERWRVRAGSATPVPGA